MRKGSKHTEEARKRMSEAANGRTLSEETRKKLSQANKGKVFSKEHRHKLSESAKSRILSEETKKKISEAKKGKSNWYEGINSWKRGKPSGMKGKRHTETVKRRISETSKGRIVSEETRRKLSESSKSNWQNHEYVKKVLANIRPNKPERLMLEYLNTINPGEWKYVGNGELVIGGLNPDFMNTNGKKLVAEMFGDYWHKGENPQDRINHFREYGFDCIVMWESELKDKTQLIEKIRTFHVGE